MTHKILDYSYASNEVRGYKNSQIAKNESNDCFVRAVASATGSNYDNAHEFVKTNFHREDKKGTQFTSVIMMKLEEQGFNLEGKNFNVEVLPTKKITNQYKLKGEVINRKKTVKSFMQTYPKGTFIVGVSGHAFTVQDGLLIDNAGEEFRPTRKVDSAFKITPEFTTNQLSLF